MRFRHLIVLSTTVFIVFGLVYIYSLPSKRDSGTIPQKLFFLHKASNPVFPENTLEGIIYLKSIGVKAVEIDLRKTADNKWVLFHDVDGMRMLGKNFEIKAKTYDQLLQYNLSGADSNSAIKVSLFENVLNRIADSLVFYLDIKIPTISNAKELVSFIKSRKLENTVLVASTNFSFVKYIKINHPEIKVILEGFDAGKEYLYAVVPKRIHPDFFASFHFRTNKKHVDWFRNHSLLEAKIVYDVKPESFQSIRDAGFLKMVVDYDSSIISDLTK